VPATHREDWRSIARACAVQEEDLIGMIAEMARALPDEISAAHSQALIDGLAESIVAPLAHRLIQHAKERLASITTPTKGALTRRTRRS
jgi:hypothetical protein